MADIRLINIEGDHMLVTLAVSKKEYSLLKEDTRDLIVLPAEKLDESLTTGTIGNSNRIMLPNKVLKKSGVKKLFKKLDARVFEVDSKKFLLIKLEDTNPSVPNFTE